MNRYVGGELKLFGLTINYQNIAEDVLNRERKQGGHRGPPLRENGV